MTTSADGVPVEHDHPAPRRRAASVVLGVGNVHDRFRSVAPGADDVHGLRKKGIDH